MHKKTYFFPLLDPFCQNFPTFPPFFLLLGFSNQFPSYASSFSKSKPTTSDSARNKNFGDGLMDGDYNGTNMCPKT